MHDNASCLSLPNNKLTGILMATGSVEMYAYITYVQNVLLVP